MPDAALLLITTVDPGVDRQKHILQRYKLRVSLFWPVAWKEKRVWKNQAINLGLVDSSIKIALCVSRSQDKSINKTLPCVSGALFSTGYTVLYKPLIIASLLDTS